MSMLADLRIAFRSLRRTRGSRSPSSLTLALGIGANAAIFSWSAGCCCGRWSIATRTG